MDRLRGKLQTKKYQKSRDLMKSLYFLVIRK